MFMRYLGGGIGHQNQRDRWASPADDESDDAMEVDSSSEEEGEGNVEESSGLIQNLQDLATQISSGPASHDDGDLVSSSEEDDDNDEEGDDDSDSDLFTDSEEGDKDDDFGPDNGADSGKGEDDNGFGEL